MRTIKPSSQFKKDIKQVKKNPSKSKGLKVLSEDIIPVLLKGGTLERKFLDHTLKGENPPKRDCHVLNDLILLYYVTDEHLLLYLPKGQSSHVLRHSFASHFIMNNGNLLALQKILGHGDIKMTMRYAHLAPDYLIEVLDKNPLNHL